MAIKPFIYEYCRRCAQKDAEVRGNKVVHGLHKCQKSISGIHEPPRESRLDAVIFIEGLRHSTSSDCWCEPEKLPVPETGTSIYVHRGAQ